ncbi:MAG: DUF349 domain-containing protein [Bacteroidales bacterium]|nr:DUF349 domain-containing protein [Bacteroidales bacterium]
MENKELKAIDANEKKKIVKLNQSSVLPGSIRIKVETLMEQPVEEEVKPTEIIPQDEVLPEIVTNEEMEEAEEEEDVVEKVDIEGKTKEELAAMLEEIVQDPDVMKEKDNVTAIRVRFMKLNKEDMDKEMEAFLESGGDKESYQHVMDDAEKRFNAAFGIYKANRARQNELLDAQKNENLAQKQGILEELKQLIASEETLKKTYDDFRALQEKWKTIGQVPATENANLWNTYHFLVEKFFDKVNINRELRDLDMKKNLDAKIVLCEKAEELLDEKSMSKAFKSLQQLHEEWKEVGPVPQDKKDEIWERFKAATDKINAIRREHYSKIQDEQNANLATKTALCEKAEELLNEEYTSINVWQKKSTDLSELFKVWKTVGPASKKQNEEIWTRFKTAMDTFFAKKKEFFANLKDRQTENLERKINLCIEAEALQESTEWKKATERFKKIQEEWKTIGPVPKRHADKIWKRFRAACDTFFGRKAEHFGGLKEEEAANLTAKQAIIEAIKNFELKTNRAENMEAIKALQKQWIEIGHVPIKVKDSINSEYRKAVDALFDKMRSNQNEITTNEYKEMVELMKDDPESSDKMRREKNNLANRIQKLRDEIAVLENNIGFFSNSKNSELMKAEYEKKINKAKNDLKVLEAKLKIVND